MGRHLGLEGVMGTASVHRADQPRRERSRVSEKDKLGSASP